MLILIRSVNMEALHITIIIVTNGILIYAIPPPACFANFRWDDCGKSPEPVMYYWKPGSRCEVGIWRGCLPNINMFRDEYECVSTCIFSVRALPPDWHKIRFEEEETTPTETTMDLMTNATVDGTVTGGETTGDGDATGGDATGGADANTDGGNEKAPDEATSSADEATTEEPGGN